MTSSTLAPTPASPLPAGRRRGGWVRCGPSAEDRSRSRRIAGASRLRAWGFGRRRADTTGEPDSPRSSGRAGWASLARPRAAIFIPSGANAETPTSAIGLLAAQAASTPWPATSYAPADRAGERRKADLDLAETLERARPTGPCSERDAAVAPDAALIADRDGRPPRPRRRTRVHPDRGQGDGTRRHGGARGRGRAADEAHDAGAASSARRHRPLAVASPLALALAIAPPGRRSVCPVQKVARRAGRRGPHRATSGLDQPRRARPDGPRWTARWRTCARCCPRWSRRRTRWRRRRRSCRRRRRRSRHRRRRPRRSPGVVSSAAEEVSAATCRRSPRVPRRWVRRSGRSRERRGGQRGGGPRRHRGGDHHSHRRQAGESSAEIGNVVKVITRSRSRRTCWR